MQKNIRSVILAGMFAAVIGVLAQFSIPLPFSPVPLTLQTFAIGLTATILGSKTGTYAIIGYLLMGMIGLPVFAGGGAGISSLVGPTGGFLVGFIFNGLITGLIIEKTKFNYFWAIVANIIGAVVTLAFGTAWLKVSGGMPWAHAFTAGFFPFVLPGIVKAVAASYIGVLVGKRLPFINKIYRHA